MKTALTAPQISRLVSDSEKREGGKGDSENINYWICNFLKIKKSETNMTKCDFYISDGGYIGMAVFFFVIFGVLKEMVT